MNHKTSSKSMASKAAKALTDKGASKIQKFSPSSGSMCLTVPCRGR